MHLSLRSWLVALSFSGGFTVSQARRLEGAAVAASSEGLGDRCPSKGADCDTCLKEFLVGCAFDFKTNSCCKLRTGGLWGRVMRSQTTSCSSALLARRPSSCQASGKVKDMERKARSLLHPHVEDWEACQLELESTPDPFPVSRSSSSTTAEAAQEDSRSQEEEPPTDTTSTSSMRSSLTFAMEAWSMANLIQPPPLSEAGTRSCMSALLRTAILADLKPRRNELATMNCDIAQQGRPGHSLASVCCMLKANHRHMEHYPCSVMMPALHGQKNILPVPPDHSFRAIRGMVPGVSEKLRASLRSGPLIPKKYDAGKSVSTFMTTADGRFILKAVRTDRQEEDRSLLKLLSGYKGRTPLAHYLLERKRKGSFTFINLILGMYEVEFMSKKETYIVMEDAAMGLGNGQDNCETRTYDLKGSSRAERPLTQANDTKKERENVEFRKYEKNTFGLFEDTCVHLTEALREDGAFLEEHHQIDYSVFARFGKSTADEEHGGCGTFDCNENRINCFQTQSGETLVISLIDYLNKFNTAKKIESVNGKYYNYAKKISEFVVSACSESAEKLALVESTMIA